MDAVAVLQPSGEVDIAAVARLRPGWIELAEVTRPQLVIVDLAKVTFVDVAGLGLLVALRNQQRRHGGQVHLRSVPAPVARLLELTGLSAVFPVEPAPRQRTAGVVIDLRVLDEEHQLRDS